jgi:non-ribosomal peptide synthetase component F
MASYYLLDKYSQLAEPVIPVGYPMAGRELFILGEQGQPLGPGEVGQIAVKSSYLSPGYWRQPELTAATFLPDPQGSEARIYLTGDMGRFRPDGCLEHLGRKDDLVKIRGQRVELAEVEMALLALAEVREAVVVAQKRAEGDNRLVAYLVPRLQPPPSVTELRTALAQTLPDHMIPAAFLMMERFPLLSFGKVDRRALPAPDTARPDLSVAYQPPQTPTETGLVDLMAQVLKLDRVGIHDNFFELGGDSLLATQLVSRIQTEFGLELPVVNLFENPTAAALARLMVKAQAESLQDQELDQLLAELEALNDEQAHQLLDLEG